MASQWEYIKWIPGTKLMVDGFRFQNANCKSYLLTHFHSDHTTGLNRGFNAGLIYCTPITARLLIKDMRMPQDKIREIPMDEVSLIEGSRVTPINANHSPGACMFLIQTKATAEQKSQTILHVGDMRWKDSMALHPALCGRKLDYLFLDTTYASPKHTHPPQEECIELMAKLMKQEVADNPRTLFVVGSYHTGKERAYFGAAKLLGWKVYLDASKRRVVRMLDLPIELQALIVTKPQQARIHVDSLGGLQPEKLQQKLDPCGSWSHVVAFRPTGWTYRKSGKLDLRQEGNVKIYGVPYSEHSSFPELRSCVQLLHPKKLIPTVNATNHAAMETIVSRFADLMDLSEDKGRLDFFIRKRRRLDSTPKTPLPDSHDPTAEIPLKESADSPSAEQECRNSDTPQVTHVRFTDDAVDTCGCEREETPFWEPGSPCGGFLEARAPSEGPPGDREWNPSPTLQTSDAHVKIEQPEEEGSIDGGAGLGVLRRSKGLPSETLEGSVKSEEGAVGCRGLEGADGEGQDIKAEGPARADSDKSSTEHWGVEGVVDLEGIDVYEQQNILRSIAEAKVQRERDIANSLTKGRQVSMASFLRRSA